MSVLKKGQLMTLEYSFKLFANQYFFSGFVQGPSFPFIISHGAQTAYQWAWRQITALKNSWLWRSALTLIYRGGSVHTTPAVFQSYYNLAFYWHLGSFICAERIPSACEQLGSSPFCYISHEHHLPSFFLPRALCQEVLLHRRVCGFGFYDHLPLLTALLTITCWVQVGLEQMAWSSVEHLAC